eukprot:SM000551S17883  [mRNA]  locus=s551:39:2760:- [translate_table: standard]
MALARPLRAALRKNALLKLRNPLSTACEILLPVTVMLMLMAVRSKVARDRHPTQAYIRKDTFVRVSESLISPSFDTILLFCLRERSRVAFAPDSRFTAQMLDDLSPRYPLLKRLAKVFSSELELENYIRSDVYGVVEPARNLSNPRIQGAIVFHQSGGDDAIYEYSIRLNHTWAPSGFPDPKHIMDTNGRYADDLQLGLNPIPIMQYGLSGFLTKLIDSYIIRKHEYMNKIAMVPKREGKALLEEVKGASVLSPTTYVPTEINVAPFPIPEYIDDSFQFIVKKVLGVLFVVAFLFPISRLIRAIVLEKETRTREGMHMMGLSNVVFFLSWFITYSIQVCTRRVLWQLCCE